MKKPIFLFLILFLPIYCDAQEVNIESILSELPNSTYEKIKEVNGNDVFRLQIRQPLDHSDMTKGYFSQKVYLSHAGFDKPMVIVTEGYTANQPYFTEVTNLLQSNQIIVEHRYFGESIPDSLDYQYLNLIQATADLHKVRELFASVYKNKWISTGVSKGGVTSIFYKYFYPEDVDASVPYVAPINHAYEEQRIYDFLDTIGTEDCRNKIKAFQIKMLKNREAVIPLLKFYSIGAKINFSYLSLSEAFEYAVMEYPFAFWQWGHSCDDIPPENSTIEEMLEYFLIVSGIKLFSDQGIRQFSSHYYQSATEMGYYGYETGKFKEYLIDLPTDANPMALFYDFNMEDEFDGQLLIDINAWLKTEGDHIVYIYGELDTWSASAVPPNNNVDSEWFMLKGKHHGNARIASMNPEEEKRLISTLEKWLSIKL